MHVSELRSRGPFIGHEGCELTGLVILVGNFNILLPDGTRNFRAQKLLDRFLLRKASGNPLKHCVKLSRGIGLKSLSDRSFNQRVVGVIGHRTHPSVLRVIGLAMKIEWRAFDLPFDPGWILYWLAN